MESDVCNFANDNTIYECDTSIEAVIIRLESDLHRMLQMFNDNGMKANPSKFQIMFLGQEDMSKLCLNINGLLGHVQTGTERNGTEWNGTIAYQLCFVFRRERNRSTIP